jgi:hypothetical protein
LDTGTKQFVAGIGIGLGAGRTCGALCDELSARAVGPERGIEPVQGRTRLSAVPSDDDGRLASVWLQSRDLFVAADSASLPRAGGLHGINGKADARFSDDQSVSIATFGEFEGFVRTSVKAMSESGIGEAGTCGAGWDKDASQREPIQIDELRGDEEARGGIEGRDRELVRASNGD